MTNPYLSVAGQSVAPSEEAQAAGMAKWRENMAKDTAEREAKAKSAAAAEEYAKQGLQRTQRMLATPVEDLPVAPDVVPEGPRGANGRVPGYFTPLTNFKDEAPGPQVKTGDGRGGPENPPSPEQGQVRAALETTVGVNPDEDAELQKYARTLGVTPDVLRSYGLDKTKMKMLADEAAARTQSSPVLEQAMADPNFAKIAHDDMKNLSAMEHLFKAVVKPFKAVASAGGGLVQGTAGVGQMGADVLDEFGRTFGALFNEHWTEAERKSYLETNMLPKDPNSPLARAGALMGRVAESGKQFADEMTPESANDIEAGIYSGLRSLGESVPWIAGAVVTGNPGVAIVGMSANVTGQSYVEAGVTNPELSVSDRAFYAAGQGVIEGLTEKIPMHALIGDITKGTPFGKTLMKQFLTELPQEQVATVLQDANQWVTLNPEKTFGEYLAERPSAALQTLVATAVATMGQTVLSTGVDKAAQALRQDQDRETKTKDLSTQRIDTLKALMQQATGSKVRERSAEDLQKFLEKAAEDSPLAASYMSPESFGQIARDAGIDPQEFAAQLGVSDQLETAAVSGSTLQFSTATILTKVAGTKFQQQFLDNLRPGDPNLYSKNEMTELKAQQQENLVAQAERVAAQASQDAEFNSSLVIVRAAVEQQIRTVAKPLPGATIAEQSNLYARVAANGYASIAQQLGITPEEAYAMNPLNVVGERVTAGSALYAQRNDMAGRTEDKLVAALDILEANPKTSNADLAKQLTDAGMPVSPNGIMVLLSTVRRGDEAIAEKRLEITERTRNRIRALPSRGGKGTNQYGPKADDLGQAGYDQKRRGEYTPSTATLGLLSTYDLSTYLHELGHHFLEVRTRIATTLQTESLTRELTPGERELLDELRGVLGALRANGKPSADTNNTGTMGQANTAWALDFLEDYIENPTDRALDRLRAKLVRKGGGGVIRLLRADGVVYAFDGYNYTHDDAEQILGLRSRDNARAIMSGKDKLEGLTWLDANGTASLGQPTRAPREVEDEMYQRASEVLDENEFEVWKLAATGMRNQDIAVSMGGEDATVTPEQVKQWAFKARQKGFIVGNDVKGLPMSSETLRLIDLFAKGRTNSQVYEQLYRGDPRPRKKLLNQIGVLKNRHKATINELKARREGVLGQGPIFYSALQRTVQQSSTKKAPAAQWKATLQKAPGVKAEELEWTGVLDWLDAQEGPVTKADLESYLEGNGVQVEEVLAGGGVQQAYVLHTEDDGWAVFDVDGNRLNDGDLETQEDAQYYADIYNEDNAGEDGTRFDQYTVPGGEDYTELLLTLPAPSQAQKFYARIREKYGREPPPSELTPEERAEYEARQMGGRIGARLHEEDYIYRPHWGETPNVVAFTRFKTRIGPNGERILALEEVQSDWHQQGREKGYKTEATPEQIAAQEAVEAKVLATANAYREAADTLARKVFADEVLRAAVMLSIPRASRQMLEADGRLDDPETGRFTTSGIQFAQAVLPNLRTYYENAANDASPAAARSRAQGLEPLVDADSSLNSNLAAVRSEFEAAEAAGAEAYAARQEELSLVQTTDIPDAPFKHNGWAALVLKRMVRWAAENGYDQLAWTPGQVHADRWGSDKTEGMAGFYDRVLVNEANKLGKKYGATVGQTGVDTGAQGFQVLGNQNQFLGAYASEGEARQVAAQWSGAKVEKPVLDMHVLPITPELKAAALEGLPLFQSGQTPLPLNAAGPEDHLDWWNQLTFSQKEPYHEIFARLTEAYFLEGKAPTHEMQGMFSKFRQYLLSVYKDITELAVDLTPEVRQFMDRMYAAGSAEFQARQRNGLDPMFTVKPDFMDENQWLEYQRLGAQAADEAQDTLAKRSLRDMKWLSNARSKALRQIQKETQAQRKAVKAEVTAEVMAEPVNIARNFFRRGVGSDGLPVLGPHKLDSQVMAVQFPDQPWQNLGYGKYGMLADDGLTADMAAEMLGYPSGEALILDMLHSENAGDKIDGLTDQRMLERYGDMSDPASLDRAADEVVHDKLRAKVLAAEHAALTQATGERRMLNDAARAAALQLVGKMPVSKLSPVKFQAAERAAARAAQTALRKGDLKTAAAAKRDQILNFHIARVISEQIKMRDGSMNLFRHIISAKKDAVSKSRNFDLVQAARAVLVGAGVVPGVTMQKQVTEYLDAVKAYDPILYANLEATLLSALTGGKTMRTMTTDEFFGMRDVVDQLWTLAREEKTIEIDGQKLELEAVLLPLKQRMEALGADGAGVVTQAPTAAQRTLRKFQGLGASLRRVESWARLMDGAKAGPFTKFIWRHISEAADRYRADRNVFVTKFRELFNRIEPTLGKKKISAPELGPQGYTFDDKAQLLHALLHTGNKSNQRKLLLGYDWGFANADGSLNTSSWDKFVARMIAEGTLTKADYDFAQSVWDLLETTKPMAQAAHRRVFGRYFNEVTADKLTTPFGEYAGGYVPAIVDDYLVQDAVFKQEQDAIEANDSSMFPAPASGFTQSRVEYNRPLQLDLMVLPQHLDKVLKFAYLAAPVRDVLRILRNRGFSRLLQDMDPTAQSDMLLPWLQRAARQIVETPTKGQGGKAVDGVMRALRRRSGMGLMFGNLVNSLQNVTGLSLTALRVKKRYLAGALVRYTKNPMESREAVDAMSSMMTERGTNQAAVMFGELERIVDPQNKLAQVTDFFARHTYFLQSMTQHVVDTVSWLGAYEQALAKGETEAEAAKMADAVVRETQGSTLPEDISRAETGSPLVRSLTHMYTYFNMWGNLLTTEYQSAVRDLGLKKGAGRLLYVYLAGFAVPALVGQALVDALRGQLPEPDDDDDYLWAWLQWFFGTQAKTAAAFVPVAGQAGIATFNNFNDNSYDDRVGGSPSVTAIESTVRAPRSVYDAIVNDADKSKAVKDSLTMLTVMTGLPFQVLSRPLGYAVDVAEGDITPTSGADYVRGLVTGAASNESR